MIRAEVAIIGAGPAGTATAIRLGQLGITDVVLVDRSDFPREKTCGSGVSPAGLKVLAALGVWEQVQPHAYRIAGLRLVTPRGHELHLAGGESASAIICSRRTLDHHLVARAQHLGVRFIPRLRAEALIAERGRVLGFSARDGREVRARYTVVADGAHSRFAVDPTLKRTIHTVMGWWEDVPFTAHHVEMIFDPMVSPLYGWLFPEGESRVNIGICYEGEGRTNARILFRQFLDRHYRTRLAGATALGPWKGHPVVYSYRVGRLWSAGRLVVGEAGRMTHPATAEGISQAMRSGAMAAEALAEVLLGGANEAQAFAGYERRCRRVFQASFWAARLWRSAVRSSVIDGLVATAQQSVVRRGLARLMASM